MSSESVTVALGALPPDSFAVVSLAATWVLVAMGLHLTFGMLGVVNLAHGELMLAGAYTAYLVHALTGSLVLGLVLAAPASAAVGWVIETSILRRLYGRPLDTLLATFGVAIVLRQSIQLLAGPNLRAVPDPVGRTFRVGQVLLPGWRLTVTLVTVLLAAALWYAVARSLEGARWRAVTTNPSMATTLAIDVRRVRTTIFVLGSGITGLAGALLAPLYSLSPQYGARFLVPAFVVVILGGAGSFLGLVLMGSLLGSVLGVLQFVVEPVSAQTAVLVVALVMLRSARRSTAWGGSAGMRP